MAFYRLEPWGFDADNWRAALVAAMVANTVRDPKKRRKPYQPVDFMPDTDTSDGGPIDQPTLTAKVDMMMAAFGGKIKSAQPESKRRREK
jgi:hypothetical protein